MKTSAARIATAFCVAAISVSALAQEAEAPVKDAGAQLAPVVEQQPGGPRGPRQGGMRQFGPGGRGREMQPGGGPSGPIFARMLSRPEFLAQLELPEETAKKIGEELAKIADEEKTLGDERGKLFRAQAEALTALMADRTKNGDDALKAVKDLESLSAKMSELNIKRMLVIRDNLTDEQIAKASELVKNRFMSRREEMMRERRPGGDRPRLPREERKPPVEQPAEKAEATPPPPPPAPAAE